jgi:hypothetical protein
MGHSHAECAGLVGRVGVGVVCLLSTVFIIYNGFVRIMHAFRSLVVPEGGVANVLETTTLRLLQFAD